MQFIVGAPVHERKKLNVFELVIRTMEGDADDTHYVNIEIKADDNDTLTKYIELLDRMSVCNVYYAGGTPGYSHVDGFKDLLMEDWPYECNSGIADSLEDYKIFFYTSEGLKHNVEIRRDE
jgi:hypothetical protein